MPQVYLLECGDRFKIGHAIDIKDRKQHLATGNPHEIRVVHIIPTSEPRKLEKFFHEKWAEKRVRGEWFTLSRPDVESFIRFQIELLEGQLYEERKTKYALLNVIEEHQKSETELRALLASQQTEPNVLSIAEKWLLTIDEVALMTGLSRAGARRH